MKKGAVEIFSAGCSAWVKNLNGDLEPDFVAAAGIRVQF